MKMRWVPVAVGVLLLSANADAAVVCAKANKKGKIKRITLRSACIGKETSLTSKDLPPSGPLLRDASGQEVGAVGSYGDVLWLQNGQAFGFYVRKDGAGGRVRSDFEGSLHRRNDYLTSDCSGQAFHDVTFYGSIELANDVGANYLVPYLEEINEAGTKGYYYTDGVIAVDAAAQPIYAGRVQYTDTGTAACDVSDTPVGGAFSCDPKLFCGGFPLAASCSCIKCCHLEANSGMFALAPRKSVDLPAFAAPFTLER